MPSEANNIVRTAKSPHSSPLIRRLAPSAGACEAMHSTQRAQRLFGRRAKRWLAKPSRKGSASRLKFAELARRDMASLIRNHQIAEDLPATVGLVLPHRQIFVHQALAAVECRLRPAPFVDKVTLLTRSPRLHRSPARPSKTRKLSSHVSLDLKTPAETLSCGTAVNSILRIRRGNQCDVPVFTPSIHARFPASIPART